MIRRVCPHIISFCSRSARSLRPFWNIVEETIHFTGNQINMPHILQCHLHSPLCKPTANSELSQLFTMWDKKSALFFFAIALSKLYLLQQFLAHIYFNKFPITRIFHILSITRDGEPA